MICGIEPEVNSQNPYQMSIDATMFVPPHLIAVVDDEAPVLRGLRRLLRGRGFEVRTYESAHEFLTALQAEKPDCLIVDFQMPGMTGLELHRHLTRAGAHIPTIVITAHNERTIEKLCLAEGVSAFLSKPLQISSLSAAIHESCGMTAPSQESRSR